MSVDFTFISGPMPYRKYGKSEEKQDAGKTVTRRKRVALPIEITSQLRSCRCEEPALDTPQCQKNVYRRTCPIEECDYLSGRYVSHNSALTALLGHLRWVHGYG